MKKLRPEGLQERHLGFFLIEPEKGVLAKKGAEGGLVAGKQGIVAINMEVLKTTIASKE